MKNAKGVTIALGYVFMNIIPEKEYDVYTSLLDEPHVVELRPLFKEYDYDLMAKIKIRKQKKIQPYVSENIQTLEGVIDTDLYY